MRGIFAVPGAALVILTSACSAGGGGKVEGGVPDGVVEVSLDLPAGCPPQGPDAANELGIGKPCSEGGGECKGGNLRCTCDPFLGVRLVGVPCYCTLAQLAQTNATDPCGPPLSASFCGSNAKCCPYLTAAAYCVPNICLPDGMCPDAATP
jgi:hypothetical protein